MIEANYERSIKKDYNELNVNGLKRNPLRLKYNQKVRKLANLRERNRMTIKSVVPFTYH